MFAGHVEAAKKSKERKQGLLNKAKLKISEKLTGTEVEAELGD